jgi:hypothetical protein
LRFCRYQYWIWYHALGYSDFSVVIKKDVMPSPLGNEILFIDKLTLIKMFLFFYFRNCWQFKFSPPR